MSFKTNSGCPSPGGYGTQSPGGVRGCGGPLLFGYAFSIAYNDEETGLFDHWDYYQPSIILNGKNILEIVPVNTFNDQQQNSQNMSVFRFYKELLYAIGNFDTFPTPPTGDVSNIAFWSKDDQFWVEPAPSTDDDYESMAHDELDDILIISGNISAGVGVANTSNIFGYSGDGFYFSVYENTVVVGSFQGSCVVSEFAGTVVASGWEAPFQNEACMIYRGAGVWEHLFFFPIGGTARMMNVNMVVGQNPKQEILVIEGSSKSIEYWDGVALTSVQIYQTQSVQSMTRYKKGVAFCSLEGVHYWDGQTVSVITEQDMQFVYEHDNVLYGGRRNAFVNKAGDTVRGLLRLEGDDWINAYEHPQKEGFTVNTDDWVTNISFHTAEPFFSLPPGFKFK